MSFLATVLISIVRDCPVHFQTGEGRPGYVKEVKKALAQAGAEGIETVLLTHDHYDHTGEESFSLPFLLGIRFSSGLDRVEMVVISSNVHSLRWTGRHSARVRRPHPHLQAAG